MSVFFFSLSVIALFEWNVWPVIISLRVITVVWHLFIYLPIHFSTSPAFITGNLNTYLSACSCVFMDDFRSYTCPLRSAPVLSHETKTSNSTLFVWSAVSNENPYLILFRLRLTEIERFMHQKLIVALSEAKFYLCTLLLICLFDDTIERKWTSREWVIAILLFHSSGAESHQGK